MAPSINLVVPRANALRVTARNQSVFNQRLCFASARLASSERHVYLISEFSSFPTRFATLVPDRNGALLEIKSFEPVRRTRTMC
jgi:hypothetical protein